MIPDSGERKFLFPGSEDDAADYADDQGETKISNDRKRECHIFSNAIGCKNLDKQHFPQTQATDGHWDSQDEEENRNKYEIINQRNFKMESFSG